MIFLGLHRQETIVVDGNRSLSLVVIVILVHHNCDPKSTFAARFPMLHMLANKSEPELWIFQVAGIAGTRGRRFACRCGLARWTRHHCGWFNKQSKGRS